MSNARVTALGALAALLAAAPALAQHAGHHDHAPPAPAQDPHAGHVLPEVPPAADPHAGHVLPAPAADPHAAHRPAPVAREGEVSPGPTVETPPPPAAGSGPPRAADAVWGPAVMAAARHLEHGAHGDFPVLWVQADRLETQIRDGHDGYLWDLQGYWGGTTRKLWLKSEGEGGFDEAPEQAEIQALWSQAVAPYWDLQLGLRHDFAGPDTTHAVIGVQGLAPYEFEVDAALFLSQRGDLTARIEGELDQRITQRLILQPRGELALSAQRIPALGIGRGIDKIELGLRLRYEIVREFAPYIGVEQSWRLGGSADHARARGEPTAGTSLVAGVRFWF